MNSPVCIPNIGPRQRRMRLIFGLTMTLMTALLVVVLKASDEPRVIRAVIAIPSFLAALGIFQARAQTCVVLATGGVRNMDDGDQVVSDVEQLRVMRRQSRGVLVRSLITAALITAGVMAM